MAVLFRDEAPTGPKTFNELMADPEALAQLRSSVTSDIGDTLARAGRGVIGGLGGLAGIVTDPVTALANEMGAGLTPTREAALQVYDEATDGAAVPQTAADRIAQAGMEALTGAGGAGLIAKVAGAAPQVVKAVGLEAPGAVTQAVGGGAGAQTAAELSDNPLMTLVGGVAGSVSPAVLQRSLRGLSNVARTAAGAPPGKPVYIMPSDEIKLRASTEYQKARDVGGLLKPSATNKFLDDVQKAVTPQTKEGRLLAGKDDAVTSLVDRVETLRDSPLTLEGVQEMDEMLGDAIDSLLDAGRPTKSSIRVQKVQNLLREAVATAKPGDIEGGKEGFKALSKGRNLWSKAMKMRDIERIMERAEGRDNPATIIKSGFRTLLMNDRKMRGFTPEQKELIKKAASTGAAADVARIFGSRLNPIIVGSTGGVGAGVASTAGAAGARNLATQAQIDLADKVARSITEEVAPPAIEAVSDVSANVGPLLRGVIGAKGAEAPENVEPALDEAPAGRVLFRLEGQEGAGLDPANEFTADNEGLRLFSYKDTAEKPQTTIGYGFNMQSGSAPKIWKRAGIETPFADAFKGKQGITRQEAENLMTAAMDVATEDARGLYGGFDRMSNERQVALRDLSYQLGLPKLSKFRNFNRFVNTGKWNLAAKALRASNYYKQVPQRAEKVIRLLMRG